MFEKLTFNKQTDLEEYNKIISNSPQGTIFSNSKFLDSLGVKYHLWNVKQGSEIKALLCLTVSKDEKKVILNDFVIYSGIIFNLDINRLETKIRSDKFKITEFIINNLVKKYNYLEFQLSPSFKDIRPFQWYNYNKKTKKKFEIETRYTSFINFENQNLNNFLETKIYNGMETVRRYDYRTAIKENAKIYKSKDLKYFFKFYSALMKNQKIKFNKNSEKKLKDILMSIAEKEIGSLFHVEDTKKNILYTLFYIWDKKKAYYFLGAGNPKKNTSWQSIFGHCEIFKTMQNDMNINVIDLEGVNSPKRGWFKLSLGGNLESYYKVKLN